MSAVRASVSECCSKSVMLYLDGEIDPSRLLETESHLAACEGCREQLELVRAMRVSLRKSMTRQAPLGFAEQLSRKLAEESHCSAEEDIHASVTRSSVAGRPTRPVEAVALVATGRSDSSRRWAMAAALLAACFVVSVVILQQGRDRKSTTTLRLVAGKAPPLTSPDFVERVRARALEAANDEQNPTSDDSEAPNAQRHRLDQLLDRLVALHANPLPPEERNPQALTRLEPFVGVPVRRSALDMMRDLGAPGSFDGARIHPLRLTQGEEGKNCAALQYKVGGHRLTVYMFDPRAMPLAMTRLRPRMVRHNSIYVGKVRGFSVAAAEKRGVSYAMASDLDEDRSIQMVASF